MRTSTAALCVSCAALAGAGAVLAQTHGSTPRTMGVDELRPGMTGYGLTVFHGTEPERFAVEIVDVLHDARPGMDMILIRPQHPILDHAGTVAGMSGSPIFIQNRLIGAYAYGWEFGRDPVAGVTPIANMLAELHVRPRTPPGLVPGTEVPLPILPDNLPAEHRSQRSHRSAFEMLRDDMVASRSPVRMANGSLVPLSVPLAVSGMSDRAIDGLANALEPFGLDVLQGGGHARTGASSAPPPQHFTPGGAISVSLITGDINASGTGTVTYVDGDSLVAFGHPMMGLGDTALPTALARIAWINPGERRSFKMSELIAPLGSLIEDRPFGIVCTERQPPPLVSMHVHVNGTDGNHRNDWNVQLAYQRSLLSRLYSSVVSSVLETAAGEQTDLAWVAHTQVVTPNHGTLAFTDVGSSPEGIEGFQVSSLGSSEAVDRLTENSFEQVRIDHIEVGIDLHFAREFYYVRSISLSRAEANPGDTVSLLISLGQYAGPPIVRSVPLEVPREVAGHDVEIEVGAGMDTLADLPEPENIDDLIRNLTGSFPEDALVVSMRLPGQGVMLRGRVIPNLPGSAFGVLRPAASTDSGEPFLNVRRTLVPVGRLVVGRDRVHLHVREIRQ